MVNEVDDNALATAAMTALRERGPLSLEEWAQCVSEFGSPSDIAEVLEYLDDPMIGYLPGGKYVALDELLEGLVFTHRLSEIEIASEVLEATPDLEPVLRFASSIDGEVRVVEAEFEQDLLRERGIDAAFSRRVVALPRGTLANFAAGDLIAIAIEDGELTVWQADVEDEPDLAQTLEKIFAENGVEALEAVGWQLAVDDSSLFTVPSTPVGEMFAAAGYEHQRELLARNGFDFAAYAVQIQTAEIASTYDLTHDEAVAVVAFADLAQRGYVDAEIENLDLRDWARRHVGVVPDSFAALADAGAAVAAFDLGFRNQDPTADMILEALGGELAERGPKAVKPAAHWLAGKAADRLGRVLDAEAHYEKALEWEADWGPALFELAQFAADRSDATRALSLLGRIDGGSEETLYEVLQEFIPVEHPELGRNDKCWCGSGRKYKVCHLGKVDESVREDGRWLYKKACMFAFSSEFADMVVQFDDLVAAGSDDDDRSIFDGPALDIALFEGGIFAQFVTRRGNLLTEHEVATARQWLDVERSVFEVTEMNTLLDRRTGDTVTVSGAADLEPGDLVCARVLPAGSSAQVVGSVIVSSELQAANVLQVLGRDHHDVAELIRVLS